MAKRKSQKASTPQSAVSSAPIPLLQPRAFSDNEQSSIAETSQADVQLKPDKVMLGHSLGRINTRPLSHLPIQPKLTIGKVGDPYEQEADQVAAQVVQKINQPVGIASANASVQRQAKSEEDELQRKPNIQRRSDVGGATASANLESSINQARAGGQGLSDSIRQPMEQAFGADFSSVKVHTDSQSDQLSRSINAKAFTTKNDIFFRQGTYEPGSRSGQELLAHELTHVVQQGGSSIQTKPTVSVGETSLQAMKIQRTPEEVWDNAGNLSNVTENDAKYILKIDFYSNWFLAQEYLLDPTKWTKHGKSEEAAQQQSGAFKGLMKTFLKLRESEKEKTLVMVREELKKETQFKNMSDKDVLDWGAAGSQSLTSDIDVNLKGAGSIQAVGLFNKLFKAKLGWSLDAGTVYDVNVYAQDFMTPSNGGKPFAKDTERNTITPAQEVEELNAPDQTSSLAFDAFALNQDVWSLVKMRIYMSDSEWQNYCKDMLENARGNGSSDAIARRMQIEAQLEDAEIYYQEYQANLAEKIYEIDHSGEEIYENMRGTLTQGRNYLSEHQQEASKKMIAANLIYEEKLKEVSRLRQELQKFKAYPVHTPEIVSIIKEIGIELKNVLSEAVIYSNEAYFTQGAVHFAVIGQQIGGGKSQLIMSDDEHLHSFREQIGSTLHVLGEYANKPIDKAIYKAGKYIDRMAKTAVPLLGETPPNGYQELALLGAAAAKLKADKTELEELRDKPAESLNVEKGEPKKLENLKNTVPQQERDFPQLARLNFETVPELRATVIAVGKQIEKDFRQRQQMKNAQNGPVQAPSSQSQNQDPQLNQVQNNIQEVDEQVGCFSGLLSMLTSLMRF